MRRLCVAHNAGQRQWSDYRKEVGGQFSLKIVKKWCLCLDIFSCLKINVFRSFFAFMLEMHVRCDN